MVFLKSSRVMRAKAWAAALVPVRVDHADGRNHQAEQNQRGKQNEQFALHNFLLNPDKKKI